MIPALIVAALIAGIAIGTRRTRRAVRTTDGRRRHGISAPHSRRIITGEVQVFGAVEPSTMERALTAATEHLHTRALYAGPAPVHPPTVAIPRVDGSLPTRPPAPRAMPKPREWDTRA